VLAWTIDCRALRHFLPGGIKRVIELMAIQYKPHLIGHQCIVVADCPVQLKKRADCVEKDRFDHFSQNVSTSHPSPQRYDTGRGQCQTTEDARPCPPALFVP